MVNIRVMKQLTDPLNRVKLVASNRSIGKRINGIYDEVDKKGMYGSLVYMRKGVYLYQAYDGLWELNYGYTPWEEDPGDEINIIGNSVGINIIGKNEWSLADEYSEKEITITMVK